MLIRTERDPKCLWLSFKKMTNGFYPVDLRIPFKDVDLFRMVWYGNYLAYFDVARAELLRAFGLSPNDQASLGFFAPVVRVKVNYHAPARHDDEVLVEVRPTLDRTAQVHFSFRIRKKEDGRLLVTGETTHVIKTMEGVLLYRIPEVLKERIEAILRELGGLEEKD